MKVFGVEELGCLQNIQSEAGVVYSAYLERIHNTEDQIGVTNKLFFSIMVVVATAFWSMIEFKLSSSDPEKIRGILADGLIMLTFFEAGVSAFWYCHSKGLEVKHRIQLDIFVQSIEADYGSLSPVSDELKGWKLRSKENKKTPIIDFVNSYLPGCAFSFMSVLCVMFWIFSLRFTV